MSASASAQVDRAVGLVLGGAVGDALGVPYEFGCLPVPGPGEPARMLGGGLGGSAPGEWSDDTAMALAVLAAARDGHDLRTDAGLDAVARGFLDWFRGDPPDVGIQTSHVLARAAARLERGEAGAGRICGEEAAAYARTHPHSAGNGALMRTGPVVLAHLHDRVALARAATAVARLTHADPLAADSCVLWCEALRVAVLEERLDVRAGLDLLDDERRAAWAGHLVEADAGPPERFAPNGFTATALQAAWAAIAHTAPPPAGGAPTRPGHLVEALHAAVRIGHDTDTVAAIAGALVGARYGAGAVPAAWADSVHGWPGVRASDLAGWVRTALRG